MRNKVNTWPGWNGNTRYPRLRSTMGWWPVTVVYRGCSPRVKRGSWRVRHDGAGLYQYSINMKYKQMAWAWKGRSEPVHTVRFGFALPLVTKETEHPSRRRNAGKKREKSRLSLGRMLNDKKICVLQLIVTASDWSWLPYQILSIIILPISFNLHIIISFFLSFSLYN